MILTTANLYATIHLTVKLNVKQPLTTSFLQHSAEDFVSNQVMEISEYFVYCGIFITKSWDKRIAQNAKGDVLRGIH